MVLLGSTVPLGVTDLYKSDVGPLVAAADLVEGEEVRTRSLQEFGVKLVTDVINHNNGRLPDERLLLRVETENRPRNIWFARLILTQGKEHHAKRDATARDDDGGGGGVIVVVAKC